jgi:hypothetical protein
MTKPNKIEAWLIADTHYHITEVCLSEDEALKKVCLNQAHMAAYIFLNSETQLQELISAVKAQN